MRVILEIGVSSIELEKSLGVYKTADETKIFLTLLRNALTALDFKDEDIEAYLLPEKEKK